MTTGARAVDPAAALRSGQRVRSSGCFLNNQILVSRFPPAARALFTNPQDHRPSLMRGP